MTERAVVLLSGGLDSATTLAIARAEGREAYALSFAYGQRHAIELAAAAEVARSLGAIEHRVATIDLGTFGGSALTDEATEIPKGRSEEELTGGGAHGSIPVTYVPARNTIFLSFALAWAEVLGARHIYIGVTAVDYSGYPDCRPEFIAAFERMANLATRAGVEGEGVTVHTPLIDWTKAQIITRGIELGVDYSLTRSCYDPSAEGAACGRCDTCALRLKGFRELGQADPAPYVLREPNS